MAESATNSNELLPGSQFDNDRHEPRVSSDHATDEEKGLCTKL